MIGSSSETGSVIGSRSKSAEISSRIRHLRDDRAQAERDVRTYRERIDLIGRAQIDYVLRPRDHDDSLEGHVEKTIAVCAITQVVKRRQQKNLKKCLARKRELELRIEDQKEEQKKAREEEKQRELEADREREEARKAAQNNERAGLASATPRKRVRGGTETATRWTGIPSRGSEEDHKDELDNGRFT